MINVHNTQEIDICYFCDSPTRYASNNIHIPVCKHCASDRDEHEIRK